MTRDERLAEIAKMADDMSLFIGDQIQWLLLELSAADNVIEAARHAVKDNGLDAEHEYFEALAAWDKRGNQP